MCTTTEFEVEGWRKIPPLMDILEQNNIPSDVRERMRLEMIKKDPIFEKTVFENARSKLDSTILRIADPTGPGKTIRDSWIYKHFTEKRSKIAIYVNAVIPINQKLDRDFQFNCVGSLCVVVSGLATWPKNNRNGIECLELDNYGGREETRYIPVDFPFFEEVQIEIEKLRKRNQDDENYRMAMNKFGKKWVLKKWGNFQTIERLWYKKNAESKEGQKKVDEAKQPSKYELLFVRGIHSCYQLKFTSDSM